MAHDGSGEVHTLAQLIAPLAGSEALAIASRLVSAFGGVRALLDADEALVKRVSGGRSDIACKIRLLGQLVAQTLEPERDRQQPVRSPQDVLDRLGDSMRALRVETLRGLFLDARNLVIADEQLAEGSANSLHFHPREVIRRALAWDATGLILIHNHPSGTPEPSHADVEATRSLFDLARELAITLHDHLIVSPCGWASMRSLGHV